MKDTLKDLNDHLFAEMERLGDEELKGEDLDNEIRRADAVSKISAQIINNGELVVKAARLKNEYGVSDSDLPAFLEDKKK